MGTAATTTIVKIRLMRHAAASMRPRDAYPSQRTMPGISSQTCRPAPVKHESRSTFTEPVTIGVGVTSPPPPPARRPTDSHLEKAKYVSPNTVMTPVNTQSSRSRTCSPSQRSRIHEPPKGNSEGSISLRDRRRSISPPRGRQLSQSPRRYRSQTTSRSPARGVNIHSEI